MTTYDGVVYDNYNSYVQFPGNLSMVYRDDVIEALTEYTFTTWLRFDEYPWELGRDMVFLDVTPSD